MSEKSDTARIEALEKIIADMVNGMEEQNKRNQKLGELQNTINKANLEVQEQQKQNIIKLENAVKEIAEEVDEDVEWEYV